MKIYTLTLGELSTNCYIVASNDNNAVLIDPADDAEKIISVLQEESLKLKKILLTHGHFDHIMAVADIIKKINVPVYIHVMDKIKLTSITENLHAYFPISTPFNEVNRSENLNDGDVIVQDELNFQVLHTPGHSTGSVCYICDDSIFSGDTLFEGSIGRTDPPHGNYSDIIKSLGIINKLEGDYKVYPGHGNSTTLDNERKNNIFLTDLY